MITIDIDEAARVVRVYNESHGLSMLEVLGNYLSALGTSFRE